MKSVTYFPGASQEYEEKNIQRFLKNLAYISGSGDVQPPPIKRLKEILEDDGCWIWRGQKFKRTYVAKRPGNLPRIYMIPFMRANVSEGILSKVYSRAFAYWVMHQIRPATSQIIKNVCGDELCIKPHPKHNRIQDRDGATVDFSKYIVSNPDTGEMVIPSFESFEAIANNAKKPH